MNSRQRMGSIARKIRRSRLWLLMRGMLLIDICLLAMCVAGFCYWAETADGAPFKVDTQRRLGWREDYRDAEYWFVDADGTEKHVELAPFLPAALAAAGTLGCVEGAYLLLQLISGRRATRRLLRPLQTMADAAQKLSEPQPDERIHHLESALQSVSPGNRLDTGDPDLKELETAVNALLEKSRLAYEEQVRFVSDASHELRTPIAVIQGYAGMLARWGKNDPQVMEESISAIGSEAGRMKKLVDQLLFLARGDSGRQKPVFEKVDLCRMLTDARDECEMIDTTHEWSLDVPDEPVFCCGDGDMLTQTLRILTDNARKYTPEGGSIRLRAGMKNSAPYFEVQDAGEGIEPDKLPRIFDRFYRVDSSREGKSGGTGLGLSIAKWIVERHGGYFEALSRPGIGTRIRVVLPEMTAEEK